MGVLGRDLTDLCRESSAKHVSLLERNPLACPPLSGTTFGKSPSPALHRSPLLSFSGSIWKKCRACTSGLDVQTSYRSMPRLLTTRVLTPVSHSTSRATAVS